ncbi:MAG: flavin monoamine oxidase family protein [Cyanobium sp.]
MASMDRAGDRAVDVVVVGAGLSGLICARALQRSGLGVQLLEARDRIGGRLESHTSAAGTVVDLGGQWVGSTHHQMASLLEELQLGCFPTYYDGDGIFHWQGEAHRAGLELDYTSSLVFFRPDTLPLPTDQIVQTLQLQREFFHLVEQVPAPAPWTAPGAMQLDRTTIASWLSRRQACPLARYPFSWLTRVGGSGGFEPWESSMLHLAWTQAVAPQRESPETWLVEGGLAQVAQRLAAELAPFLQLGTPVRAIEDTGTGVRVHHSAGATEAKAVVVAIPPPLRLGLHFSPPLPATWRGLLQRSPMGAMVKVLALYPEAFWREEGLNGLGIGTLPTLELVVDSSPPGGQPGILAGFIAAERAVQWQMQPDDRREALVKADLAAYFGARATNPSELILKNWNGEPWSGGAFTSFLIPGTWHSYGSIWQESHGRVIWAGTEAAQRWPGYAEGAIEAGLAAAGKAQEWL